MQSVVEQSEGQDAQFEYPQQPRAQDASPTIRGFVHQVEVTLERWFELKPGERLLLEFSEDIDLLYPYIQSIDPTLEVIPRPERRIEQVKAFQEGLTLRRDDAATAVAHFFSHVQVNPDEDSRYRFCTTAAESSESPRLLKDCKLSRFDAGERRTLPGRSGLSLWKTLSDPEVSTGARAVILTRIRSVLCRAVKLNVALDNEPRRRLSIKIPGFDVRLSRVRRFGWTAALGAGFRIPKDLKSKNLQTRVWQPFLKWLLSCTLDEFEALIRRVEWSTDHDQGEALQGRLEQRLIDLGHATSTAHANEIYPRLFLFVFRLLCKSGIKELTSDGLVEQVQHTPLSGADRQVWENLPAYLEQETRERLAQIAVWRKGGRFQDVERELGHLTHPDRLRVLPPDQQVQVLTEQAFQHLRLDEAVDTVSALISQIETLGGDTLMLRANVAYLKDELPEVLALLEGQEEPSSVYLHTLVLLQQGKAEATAVLEPWLEGEQSTSEAFRLAALGYLAQGNLDKALAVLERGLQQTEPDVSFQALLGIVLYTRSLSPVARPLGLPGLPYPLPRGLWFQDEIHRAELRRAQSLFAKICDTTPQQSRWGQGFALWYLASLCADKQRSGDALELAQKLMGQEWSDPEMLGVLVHTLSLEELTVDLDGARERLEASLESVVEPAAILGLVHAKLAAGLHQEASALVESQRSMLGENRSDQLLSTLAGELSNPADDLPVDRANVLKFLLLEQQAHEGRWPEVCEAVSWLVDEVQTGGALEYAAYALYNTGEYAQALEVLERSERFPTATLPTSLAALRFWSLLQRGQYPEASAALEQLRRRPDFEDGLDGAVRLNLLMQDQTELVRVGRELLETSLEAGLMVAVIDAVDGAEQALRQALWQRVAQAGVPEDQVRDMLRLGFALELDYHPKLAELLTRAQMLQIHDHSSEDVEGVRAILVEQQQVRQQAVRHHLSGHISVHQRTAVTGEPLSGFYPVQPREGSSHRVLGRHAGRPADLKLPSPLPGRWVLDQTALLAADFLELLPLLEVHAAPLYISPVALSALAESRQAWALPQPSRLIQAHAVQRVFDQGRLYRVEEGSLTQNPIFERWGGGWEVAGPAAQALGGRVVDDVITRGHALNEDIETTVPGTLHPRILLDELERCGELETGEAKHKRERLWTAYDLTSVSVTRGDVLILTDLGLELLLQAELLDLVCSSFKVYVPEAVVQPYRDLLRNAQQAEAQQKRLRALSSRIQAGMRASPGEPRYQTLPLPPSRAVFERTTTHTLADLNVLLVTPLTSGDVLWVEDRWSSGLAQTAGGATLVTAWDVVHWLEEAGHINEEKARNLLRKMRQAGWAFLPFGEQDLSVWLERAGVHQGAVQETQPLVVWCRHLHAQLRQAHYLSAGSGNPSSSEVKVFWDGVVKGILDVLCRLWQDSSATGSVSEKCDWVMDLIDPVKVDGLSDPVARACDAVRHKVLHELPVRLVGLPTDQLNAFQRWHEIKSIAVQTTWKLRPASWPGVVYSYFLAQKVNSVAISHQNFRTFLRGKL